jgi:hypothetical protein
MSTTERFILVPPLVVMREDLSPPNHRQCRTASHQSVPQPMRRACRLSPDSLRITTLNLRLLTYIVYMDVRLVFLCVPGGYMARRKEIAQLSGILPDASRLETLAVNFITDVPRLSVLTARDRRLTSGPREPVDRGLASSTATLRPCRAHQSKRHCRSSSRSAAVAAALRDSARNRRRFPTARERLARSGR